MVTVGTIFDIKQYAIHDGPGIRTTVFLKGCPLDCAWCHNPEGRCPSPEPMVKKRSTASEMNTASVERTIGCTVTADFVIKEVLRDEIFYDQSGGGVTFSGGEPMMQIDFLDDLLRRCRRYDLHTAVDTCGYAPWEAFERIVDAANLFLYDLKVMDDRLHRQYTGVSNRLIHENLIELSRAGVPIITRIPLIAGVTDTDDNLEAVVAFLKPLPSLRRIDLLPYNKLGEDKIDRYGLERARIDWTAPSDEKVDAARRLLESHGFHVKIGG